MNSLQSWAACSISTSGRSVPTSPSWGSWGFPAPMRTHFGESGYYLSEAWYFLRGFALLYPEKVRKLVPRMAAPQSA